MKKFFFISMIFFAFFSCRTEGIDVSKVVVFDSGFQQLRVIDQPDLLKQLNELWTSLEPIDELPNTQWTHKLDIESKDLSGRWLYNQEGYLAKLNKALKPSYKVTNKEAFNKIILGF